MSYDDTQWTKLGTKLDVHNVSGTPTMVYRNKEEMEDIASSSVKLVGQKVPKSSDSTLGLCLQNPIIVDSLCTICSMRTVETRSVIDAMHST